jgi:hypothetical protein
LFFYFFFFFDCYFGFQGAYVIVFVGTLSDPTFFILARNTLSYQTKQTKNKKKKKKKKFARKITLGKKKF